MTVEKKVNNIDVEMVEDIIGMIKNTSNILCKFFLI